MFILQLHLLRGKYGIKHDLSFKSRFIEAECFENSTKGWFHDLEMCW